MYGAVEEERAATPEHPDVRDKQATARIMPGSCHIRTRTSVRRQSWAVTQGTCVGAVTCTRAAMREHGTVSDDDSRAQQDRSAGHLIEAGAELVGMTGGAALGLCAGGAPGAVAGAAAGSALSSLLADIGRRLLGRREEVRVGAAAIWADIAYKERIENGDQLRNDDWFGTRPKGRSAAEEICEGTLLMAQREHEERKVEFFGYLLANIGFEPAVDENLANWLLELAEQLTWTQLVLLGMIGRKQDFELPAIEVGGRTEELDSWGVHEQLTDLGYARRELIGAPRKEPLQVAIGRINLDLPDMELRRGGTLLYAMMSLNKIPDSDIELLIELLQPPSGGSSD